jgi:hypothetical protein
MNGREGPLLDVARDRIPRRDERRPRAGETLRLTRVLGVRPVRAGLGATGRDLLLVKERQRDERGQEADQNRLGHRRSS